MLRKMYMKITMDEYQLPIYYADSIRELSKMCGVPSDKIERCVRGAWKNKRRKQEYIVVTYNDHDNS